MTPFPYTVDVHETASLTLLKMKEHDIRHLPVTELGTLMGIISERDITRVLDRADRPDEVLVREVFHGNPYQVELDQPLTEVLKEMSNRQVGSVLVLRHGKLVGIFTTTDACLALANLIDELRPDSPDEAA